jgi:GntR family transcriptional regulator
MAKTFSQKRDVYVEIAKRYENFIRLKIIQPGEKLPSVRVAAGELGVNPNTVQRAYNLLEEDGFIRSFPKKGTFVTYEGENTEIIPNRTAAKAIANLKESGITKTELISIIEEVYTDD